MQEPEKPSQRLSLGTAVGIFLGVAALWALTPIVLAAFIDTLEHRGQFGDLFGSTNALFSGLAFAGVVLAIILQGQELGLQIKELAETSHHLREDCIPHRSRSYAGAGGHG